MTNASNLSNEPDVEEAVVAPGKHLKIIGMWTAEDGASCQHHHLYIEGDSFFVATALLATLKQDGVVV